MKFINKEKKERKFNISKKNLLLGLLMGISIMIGVSGVAFAKYYAKRDNKGVSVASGLYFNSNCISNVAGDIDIPLDQIDLQKAPGYVNPEGGSIFYLDIRNYDNHLLYNELYLDVEYTISFLKINGETASVEYTDDDGNNVRTVLEDGKEFTLTGREIEGGAARYHSYIIKTENAVDGSDAKVLVMAYPTAPDYVAVAAEDMRLLGVLTAQPKDVKVGIDKAGFLIEDTSEYESDWKNTVETMSGLVYTIQTNGDDVSSSGAVKGELKVTWNSKMLDINQYDTYYQEALDAIKKGDTDAIVTNGDYKTMTIKVLPYANVRITFYKTADFVAYFDDNDSMTTDMTQSEFENYVKATLAESE